LGVWLAMQLIGALSGSGGVAWWAHIGGFVAGGLIAWNFRRSHQEEVTRKLALPGTPPPKILTWY
ncbi:MAG TPA: rhomboid family intramembrane serine protease, partial [Pseudomonadota bacterium]|nr:rhomboid family intramembrane serine protease [Pseudomonadota bacterium]